MDLSILIPVYNSEKIIEDLIKQIIDSISDIKSIHSYEIILIDLLLINNLINFKV